MAAVQPNSRIRQEEGEEKAAHPGTFYTADLGVVGAGDKGDHLTEEQTKIHDKI